MWGGRKREQKNGILEAVRALNEMVGALAGAAAWPQVRQGRSALRGGGSEGNTGCVADAGGG